MREVFGMAFYRRRNDFLIGGEGEEGGGKYLSNIVTTKKEIPKEVSAERREEQEKGRGLRIRSSSSEARMDLLIASITMKYTQSNSVGYAKGKIDRTKEGKGEAERRER